MKKLILSITFVSLVLSLTAQTSEDFFASGQKWPTMPVISYFNDIALHESEICSTPTNMLDNIGGVRPDSILNGHYATTYSYNANGNLISQLTRLSYSGTWVPAYRTTYVYNGNDKLITETVQSRSDETWETDYIFTSGYDLQGNQLTYLIEQFESGELINANLYTYTHDDFGNQLTSKLQVWNGIDWQNYLLITYSFNELNKLETELHQNWDDGAWIDHYRASYTYDSNGILASIVAEQVFFGAWVYVFQKLYTADEYGNLNSQLVQYWDTSNEEWYDHSLSMRTFNEDGLWLTDLIQELNAGELENDRFFTRSFDLDNNLTESTIQTWENDEWLNNARFIVNFISGLADAQAFEWDGSAWTESINDILLSIFMHGVHIYSESGAAMEFYYTDVTDIEEQIESAKNIIDHCYPNPVADQINIEIKPALATGNYTIELFNQSGQSVKSLKLSPNSTSSIETVNVEDLPPGLYVLKVTMGKSTYTQKVIIE